METITLHSRKKSQAIYEESCNFIPFGVNSPVRALSHLSLLPLVARSGKGDVVIDVDGNHYIDYCQSWGALIHGHAPLTVVNAVQKRVSMGSSFGMTTEEELLLAKKVREHMPALERVRFVSSGSEATMSALRLARGFTGKEYFIKFTGNYHGHADPFLVKAGSGVAQFSTTSSSLGVTADVVKYTLSLPYNCIESVRRAFRDPVLGKKIAAVMIEPIAGNMGLVPAESSFLAALRTECDRAEALLIFDEVISGFRVGLGGATEHYQITPDLITLGKIVGGGYPAAAFGGRAEVMRSLSPEGGVYQAGTLSGNPVAMVAGYESIRLCEGSGFYQELEEKCKIITKPVANYIQEKEINACVQELGSSFTLFFGVKKVRNFQDSESFDLSLFKQFYHYLFERGIYFSPSQFEVNFISAAHQEAHLTYTRDVILSFLQTL